MTEAVVVVVTFIGAAIVVFGVGAGLLWLAVTAVMWLIGPPS